MKKATLVATAIGLGLFVPGALTGCSSTTSGSAITAAAQFSAASSVSAASSAAGSTSSSVTCPAASMVSSAIGVPFGAPSAHQIQNVTSCTYTYDAGTYDAGTYDAGTLAGHAVIQLIYTPGVSSAVFVAKAHEVEQNAQSVSGIGDTAYVDTSDGLRVLLLKGNEQIDVSGIGTYFAADEASNAAKLEALSKAL